MKKVLSAFVSLMLAVAMVLSVMPWTVSAFQEDLQDENAPATSLLQPVNPHANQEAKNLLAYLGSLTDTDQFVVGQFDIATTNHVWDSIENQYGVTPALYSNRYILNTTDNLQAEHVEITTLEQTNSLLAQHYNEGHILLVHVDGPQRYLVERGAEAGYTWKDEGYGMVTELDATNPDRNLSVYTAWMEYIDEYIMALQDLEDRGVKAYMTRPFVESNMCDMWGNDAYYNETFIRVYRQFVQHFIDSDLNGWLMTFSPGGRAKATGTYPGNEWLDIIGVTCYTGTGWDGYINVGGFPQYDWYCALGKPFGLTEVSCRGDNDSAPKASWYNTLKSIRDQWPAISYACCWGDGNWSLQLHKNGNYQSGQDDGKAFLCSPFSINSGNMADYQSGQWTMPGLARVYADKNMTGGFIGLEEKLYTESELKAMGFNGKVGSLDVNRGFTVTFYTEDNGKGDYWGYGNDLTDGAAIGGGKAIRSIRVARQEIVSERQDVYVYASDNDGNSWKINDGMPARWTSTSKTGDTYWVAYDMGKPVTVNRYVVRHAGYADEARVFNASDFRFQYSHDDETWITVDTITGNTGNKTDRMIVPVTAQYLRLEITKPNFNPAMLGDGISICEWEVFGVDSGKAYVEPTDQPTPPPTESNEPEDGDNDDTSDEFVDNENSESGDVSDDFTDTDDTVGENEDNNDTDTSDGNDTDVSDDMTSDVTDDETLPEDDESDNNSDGDDQSADSDKTPTRKPVKVVTTETYFPWWGWVLIGVGVLAAAGVILLLVLRAKRKKA